MSTITAQPRLFLQDEAAALGLFVVAEQLLGGDTDGLSCKIAELCDIRFVSSFEPGVYRAIG